MYIALQIISASFLDCFMLSSMIIESNLSLVLPGPNILFFRKFSNHTEFFLIDKLVCSRCSVQQISQFGRCLFATIKGILQFYNVVGEWRSFNLDA